MDKATTGDVPADAVNSDFLYEMVERKDLARYKELGGTEGIGKKYLKTDMKRGIMNDSIASRKEKYGENVLPPPEEVTFFGLVMDALGDRMMQILMGAAVVSLILGLTVPDPHTGKVEYATGWIEGAAILMSVAMVVSVTATNDYQKSKKFAQLNEQNKKKNVEVIREGVKQTIDSSEIVVGDILLVHSGDILPVDGVLIDGVELRCDESAATGESDMMTKEFTKDPFFLSGTNLVEGAGRCLVTGVGEKSFSGKTSMEVRGEGDETPLQVKLGELADQIGYAGMCAAILTFVTLSCKEIYYIWNGIHPFHLKPFLDFVIVSVTIVVVAIPEGLPLAVTISLAYSMASMMQDNCLVRILASCETMGGATSICSDKTGTLTTNQMTVVQAWIAERRIIVPGTGIPRPKKPKMSYECSRCQKEPTLYQCENCRGQGLCEVCNEEVHRGTWKNHERKQVELQKENLVEELSDQAVDIFCEACVLNSTAEEKLDTDMQTYKWEGNKTEIGILKFLKEKIDKDPRGIKHKFSEDNWKTFPFNSDKKMMSTVVKKDDGKMVLYVKGAPEILLPNCTWFLSIKGKPEPIDDAKREYLKAVITDMALMGNRVLLLGSAELKGSEFPAEEPAVPLCCCAILGIQDPIRPEVPEAVATCQKAGILVRMVTGDNKQTAVSIAEKAGIFQKDLGVALEGKEFRQMLEDNPEELRKSILPKLQVLARSTPLDKHKLVKLIQEEGAVTAVTGDGTNDAPALKLADVGFAMRSGTDIAKAASDIVLLDDNFVSVVKAAMWGRNVNDNIRKFIQFQVTVNVVGVMLTFIGAAVSTSNISPLTPVQLLWLNLIMDTLAALALATEQPSMELLNRPPLPKEASLISLRMWTNIGGHAAYQLSMMLLLLFYGHLILRVPKDSLTHRTVVFNSFILMQVWNEFNARKLHQEQNVFDGILRSKGHLAVTGVMVAFQFFAVQIAGDFFGTTPLSFLQWIFCGLVGAFAIPWGIALRRIPVPDIQTGTAKSTLLNKDENKFKIAGQGIVHKLRVSKALKHIPRNQREMAEGGPVPGGRRESVSKQWWKKEN